MRLLIDVSGIVYRSAYKLDLTDAEGNPSGAIFGTLRTLEHLAERLQPEEMIICWDGGSAARKAIYPEYKATRKRDPAFVEALDAQLKKLRAILDMLPVVNLHVPGAEADDVIALLVPFLKHEHVGIVTGDHDLYQLLAVSDKHKAFDYDGRPAKLDLKPSQYVTYKVLVGDNSDNIKGVEGVGPVRAKQLLAEHKTLKRIMRFSKAGNKLGKMEYGKALPIVRRNLKLIKLDGALLDEQQRLAVFNPYRKDRTKTRLDENALRAELMRLGMASIVSRLSGFLHPFRRLVRAKNESRQTTMAQSPKGRPTKAKEARKTDQKNNGVKRYWRRVRKTTVCSDGGSRVWRRIRKVAEARPLQTVIRISPTGVKEMDPRSVDGSAKGALSAMVRQARASRARGDASGVSNGAESLPAKHVSQADTLRCLSSLDRKWIKRQTSETCKRILGLIDKGIAKQKFSKDERAYIAWAHNEFTLEMPTWMLTRGERQERKRNARANRSD